MTIEEVLKLENNKNFEGVFAVVNVSLKPFKEKEGNYLAFFLQDKTGREPAKIWDNADKWKEKIVDDIVIFAKGKSNIFSGKNQVVLDEFEIQEKYDLNNFLLSSKLDAKVMLHELKSILFSEMNPELNSFLTKSYFNDEEFMEQFTKCPGGKGEVHHAYIHGLLEHTLGTVKLCNYYCDLYPEANCDILKTGAFLHDLGKIYSYKFGISIEMTDVGRLHGHACLGYFDFLTKINDFDGMLEEGVKSEYKKLLGHMILSHHGSFDKQAAATPMTLEATLLVKADSTDADANFVSTVVTNKEEDWTPFNYLMNRSYYKKIETLKEEVKEIVIEKKKVKKDKQTLYKYEEK